MKQVLKGVRILHLVVNDIQYDQRLQRIITSLQKAGAEVTVFGRDLGKDYEANRGGVQFQRFSIRPQSGPLMYAQMNRKYGARGRKSQWDIVVSNDFDTLPAGYWISRGSGAHWVLDAHEHFIEVPELEGRLTKRLIWHGLGNWAIPKLDLAMTVSDSLARQLSATYGQHFEVIENFPSLKHPSLPVEKRENVLFYRGALNRGRGLEAAIEALCDLENYRLELAGGGDISGELQAYVRRLQLEDRVVFHGWLQSGDLDRATEKARYGLNLLEGKSLNYYYSLANKFFDYAQLGVPSINPPYPEYRSYLNQFPSGLILEKCDGPSLARLIKESDRDGQNYQDLCRGARQLAQHAHWEEREDRLIQLYASLLRQ